MPFDDAYPCVLLPYCCQQSAFSHVPLRIPVKASLSASSASLAIQVRKVVRAVNPARQKYVCNVEHHFSLNSYGELPGDL